MAEQTEIHRRVAYLEKLVLILSHRLDSVAALAGKAAQEGGGGSGGGGSVGVFDAYVTTAIGPRNVNALGTGFFKFATTNAAGTTLAATGDVGDSGIAGYNNTAGTIPVGAFGYVVMINYKWRFIEADCLSTTTPGSI
jgi:hypothetical protein